MEGPVAVLQPLGKAVAGLELVLAPLDEELELLEPGQQELQVLVVLAQVLAPGRAHLLPNPFPALPTLPQVLVQLQGNTF